MFSWRLPTPPSSKPTAGAFPWVNLRKNIATLKLEKQSTIVPGDPLQMVRPPALPAPPPAPPALPSSAIAAKHPSPITLAFLDPPYRYLREQPAQLQSLTKNLAAHLAPEGIIIFRHDSADSLALPLLRVHDVREYGSMAIEFLKPC